MMSIRKKVLMVFVGVFMVLVSYMVTAWFGEVAVQRERIELEFRNVFVMVVYLMLYGTYEDREVGVGLLKIFDSLQAFVLMNPPLNDEIIRGVLKYSIIVLQPLYLTSILATGIYLLFFSASPGSRRKAKQTLWMLIASAVAVAMSFQILQLFFNISGNLASSIIRPTGVKMETLFIETINELVVLFSSSAITTFDGGYMFLLLILFLVMGLYLTLTARYLIVLFYTLLFPAGILLYALKTTRGIGRTILENIILWTFMQVEIVIVIVAASIGVKLFGVSGDLKTLMGLTAFIAVITSPWIIAAMVRRFLP